MEGRDVMLNSLARGVHGWGRSLHEDTHVEGLVDRKINDDVIVCLSSS